MIRMKALAPYQSEAVAWLSNCQKGIVQVPAGGGKTVIAAHALAHICINIPARTFKIGWIAPTVETRDQAIAAMRECPALLRQHVRVRCVSPDVDMSDRNILVIDECKHAIAPMWRKIAEQCPRRWGLDATPFGDDKEKSTDLLNLFGNQIYTVSRGQVGSRLVPARVRMLQASDDCGQAINDEIAKIEDRLGRQSKFMVRKLSPTDIHIRAVGLAVNNIGIAQNKTRTEAAIRLAHKHSEDFVLILVNQVEHGQELAAAIGNGARAISAKVGKRIRTEAMNAVRSGECRCIIATSLADEGLDLPRLNVLILLSGGKSKIKAEQRTGRVLRSFEGKENGIIYDFLDTQHATMAAHSRKRVSLYRSLGYQIANYHG